MYENHTDEIFVAPTPSFGFPLHAHYNIEICICIDGNIWVECNGKSEMLSRGDAMLALSNDLHGYYKTEYGKQIMIILNPHILPRYFREILKESYENFCKTANDEIIAIAQKLYDELNGDNDTLTKIGYISLLAAQLLKQLPKRKSSDTLDEDTFTKVVKFISDHFTEELSLREIASKFGVDYYNLCKLFSKRLALTFTKYVHLLRIEEAKLLLKNTSTPITQVCYDCGFSDVRTFNRVFKNLCGVSPKIYRAANSNKKQARPY